MYVQYWSVGSTSETDLPMTKHEISSHLLQDWVPSIPASVSSSFMGWPLALIEETTIGATSYLSLRQVLGATERQWKRFVSWMLGVAGTRHVLASEGYRWIAPVSAFDPRASHEVDIAGWHPSFPRSIVTATRAPNSSARLCPDYLAIRDRAAGGFEWAAVEAKGTCDCLTNMANCPRTWRTQAHNVRVEVAGRILKIPRHMVVATRVNPNAKSLKTRRLQVRSWNSQEHSEPLAEQVAVEIVAAHLFGLFQNLRLHENARALALSVLAREEYRQIAQRGHTFEKLQGVMKKANAELKERTSYHRDPGLGGAFFEMLTEFGSVSIQLSATTISLAQRISSSITAEEGVKAIADETPSLKQWELQDTHGKWVVLNSGVRVQFRTET